MLFIVIMGYNRCSPGVRDVNCRQLCFIKYQMLVFRSKPLARNDSVDVITGIGIVLVLPNGFGSIGIVGFDDSYILLPTLWFCIYFFPPFLLLLSSFILFKYVYKLSSPCGHLICFVRNLFVCPFVFCIVRFLTKSFVTSFRCSIYCYCINRVVRCPKR